MTECIGLFHIWIYPDVRQGLNVQLGDKQC